MKTSILFSELKPELSQLFLELLQRLPSSLELLLVGGVPRDFVLYGELKDDLDFEVGVTKALSDEEYLGLFNQFISTLSERFEVELLSFGIVRFLHEQMVIEVTPTRRDIYQKTVPPFLHKDFTTTPLPILSLEERFLRRDFTVNSMAFRISESRLELVDPYNGLNDLQSKKLRTVNPDFFKDPVRILRAIRFELEHGLSMSDELLKGVSSYDFSLLTPSNLFKEMFKTESFVFLSRVLSFSAEYEWREPLFFKELLFLLQASTLRLRIKDSKELLVFWRFFRPHEEAQLFTLAGLLQVSKKFVTELLALHSFNALPATLVASAQMGQQERENEGSKLSILSWSEVENKERAMEELLDIFFQSSGKKSFKDDEEKKSFFHTWAGAYLKLYPERFFMAFAPNGRLAGYLAGCCNSGKLLAKHEIPGLHIFADLFPSFPAHLHINCHSDFRGVGIGARLVEFFISHCLESKISGIHIVTGKGARNISFYRKMGFVYSETRSYKGADLFFMGCPLKKGV